MTVDSSPVLPAEGSSPDATENWADASPATPSALAGELDPAANGGRQVPVAMQSATALDTAGFGWTTTHPSVAANSAKDVGGAAPLRQRSAG